MIDASAAFFKVKIEGLATLSAIKGLPKIITSRARSAIAKTIVHARAKTSDQIRREVRFTSDYLTGANGKLRLTLPKDKLEAKITANPRQSSLAKFMVGQRKTGRNRGVTVEIAPGKRINMPRAFTMQLKQGNGVMVDTGAHNLGLMMRVSDSEKPKFKKHTWHNDLKKNSLRAYYGPSVGQTFMNVAEQNEVYLAKYLEREFIRLMKLEQQ